MESFPLSGYRQERGASTLCNFGRFHPRYRKSTNRKDGLQGGNLAEDQKDNPAGWPGIAPLEVIGKPGDHDWMGFAWMDREPLAADNAREVPAGAGLYLLVDAGSHEIMDIGKSADAGRSLIDQSRKTRDNRSPEFSYRITGLSVLPLTLMVRENDPVGNFFLRTTGRHRSTGSGTTGDAL